MLKMSQNSWILLKFKRQCTEFSIYGNGYPQKSEPL